MKIITKQIFQRNDQSFGPYKKRFRFSILLILTALVLTLNSKITWASNQYYQFDEKEYFYPLNAFLPEHLASPVSILDLFAEKSTSRLSEYLKYTLSLDFQQTSMQSIIEQATHSGNIDLFLSDFMPRSGSRYVLIHRSRSLQAATKTRPRVVVFDHENSWAFSFTHPENRNGHLLEFQQYNQKTRQFEFQSIDFSSQPPTVSELNPPRCLRCHSNTTYVKDGEHPLFKAFGPRPNWDAGFIWRGAFGGRNDSNFWHMNLTTEVQDENTFTPLSLDQDRDDLTEFFKNHVSGNRYQVLKPLEKYSSGYYKSRNASYNLSISYRNAERVAYGLMKTPFYPKLRTAIREIFCRSDLESETTDASQYDLVDFPRDFQPLPSGKLRKGGIKASLDLANLLLADGMTKKEILKFFGLMTTSTHHSEANGLFQSYETPGVESHYSSRWLLSPIANNADHFNNLFGVTCQILNVIDPLARGH